MEIGAFLQLLRRRWTSLAVCLIAGVLGSTIVTETTPALYEASAHLFVNIPAARGVQEALQGVQLSSQLLQSYAKLATSRAAATRVAERLSGRFEPGEVLGKVSAAPQPETLLIDIKAVDADPGSARDLANAAAASLIELIDELESSVEGGVQARVIDEAELPGSPVSPRPKVNLALGTLLALATGLGLALVLESLDKSITTNLQASEAFNAPVLVAIPRHRKLETEPLVALEGSTSHGGEAYRALRTSLRFLNAEKPLKTVLVTSAGPGEGKTTTAANLAIAIAQSGERVVVVDADLRKSSIAATFGLGQEPGLTTVVLGETPLTVALQPWRGMLSVLAAGALPPNPSEVLGSEAMIRLLDEAAAMADVVVIDSTPILPVTDAAVLGAHVDAVVIVTQWAKTQIAEAEEARYTLDGVSAPVVGVVLNNVRGSRSRAYYRGYGYRPPRPTEEGAE